MRPDKNSTLAEAQSVTASGASTSCLKVGTNAGAGRPLTFLFTVTAAWLRAAGAIGTVFSLQCATTSGGSYADVVATASIAKALLVVGYQFTLTLPSVHAAWVQAYWTNANVADSGGITVQLMESVDSNRTH